MESTKLFTAVHDAVIDFDRPFAELRLVKAAEFVREEIKVTLDLSLDSFICPDSIWLQED